MNKIRSLLISLLSLSLLVGCQTRSQNTQTQAEDKEHAQFDSLQKIVAQTAQTYKEMSNTELFTKLADQSRRQKEPFNSLAYRELRTRKNVSTDTLIKMMDTLNNQNGILPLLLVRELNKQAYMHMAVSKKALILTDALESSSTFNMWGLPPFYVEDAGKAIIECDTAALPALKRMLHDTRPAPVYGSKEYMMYLRYQYRLCDYALYFIKNIQGDKNIIIPQTRAGRDSLISQLK